MQRSIRAEVFVFEVRISGEWSANPVQYHQDRSRPFT